MGLKNKIGIVAICIIGSVFIISCQLDPWVMGKKDTDIVTITKTTKRLGANADKPLMRAQVGAVKMSHKVHVEQGLQCIQCHHKKGNDSREKKCAVCHYGDNGYEVMHGLCVDCHISKNKGPQKCKQCH